MSAGPLESSLPSHWYHREDVFRIEREHIFFKEWVAVCREEELPAPGDHLVADVLGESVLLVRNRERRVRAFYNVCRHRGARLCRAAGAPTPAARVELKGGITARQLIVCPYHRWSYDLDGRLVAAPHLSAGEGMDRREFDLYPIAVESWGGFVFLNFAPDAAPPLAARLGGIDERLRRYPLSDLRMGASIRYEVAANWKILCENYNECYHCAGLHPELCAVVPAFRNGGGAGLDWSRGVPHREGAYTFTSSGTSARRAFPGLDADEQVRHKGELLYPNLFLSLACDHAAVFLLMPRDAGRTDVTCHFLFESHEMGRGDFDPADVVEFWDLVNRQDWTACESVQEGIRARVHRHGYYAPMEDWNLDIRRYVSDRIAAHLP